jgi:hypothetical protein
MIDEGGELVFVVQAAYLPENACKTHGTTNYDYFK